MSSGAWDAVVSLFLAGAILVISLSVARLRGRIEALEADLVEVWRDGPRRERTMAKESSAESDGAPGVERPMNPQEFAANMQLIVASHPPSAVKAMGIHHMSAALRSLGYEEGVDTFEQWLHYTELGERTLLG